MRFGNHAMEIDERDAAWFVLAADPAVHRAVRECDRYRLEPLIVARPVDPKETVRALCDAAFMKEMCSGR